MKQLPLIAAYDFGARNGIENEVEAIKRSRVGWKSYTSLVKRGFIIELFEKRGLFEKFKNAYWPFGNTASGITATKRYLNIKNEFERAGKRSSLNR